MTIQVSIRADVGPLQRFAAKLRRSPAVVREAVTEMATEALRLVQESFDKEQSPDGRKWRPTKAGNRPILVRTGRLRGGFTVSRGALGFTIINRVGYAVYHQGGTRRMVARPMLPKQGRLPAGWQRSINGKARAVFRRRFGRG
jgi:phage gpG-like protein